MPDKFTKLKEKSYYSHDSFNLTLKSFTKKTARVVWFDHHAQITKYYYGLFHVEKFTNSHQQLRYSHDYFRFFEIFNSKNNEGTVIGELFSTRYMLKLQYNSKLKKKSTITWTQITMFSGFVLKIFIYFSPKNTWNLCILKRFSETILCKFTLRSWRYFF